VLPDEQALLRDLALPSFLIGERRGRWQLKGVRFRTSSSSSRRRRARTGRRVSAAFRVLGVFRHGADLAALARRAETRRFRRTTALATRRAQS